MLWIWEGIKTTQDEWPGIASELRGRARRLRENHGDVLQVATIDAQTFFGNPMYHSFKQLEQASQEAGVWTQVEPWAMRYLETGKSPSAERTDEGQALRRWPLPPVELPAFTISERRREFPATDTLIAIAIAANRPDQVLRWYDERRADRATNWAYWGSASDADIADAVVESYPDRAIAIWQHLAGSEIARVDLITNIRMEHLRKRRLMEILDIMEGIRTGGRRGGRA
jgi:uncharacterized Zn finger protein